MADDKVKVDNAIECAEVATQTAKMFKLPNGEIVGLEDYLVWLGNTLVQVKKALVGK